MRLLSGLFMLVAAVSLAFGAVLRLFVAKLPLGDIPPQSFLEFSGACLLFAIALSVFSLTQKSS